MHVKVLIYKIMAFINFLIIIFKNLIEHYVTVNMNYSILKESLYDDINLI